MRRGMTSDQIVAAIGENSDVQVPFPSHNERQATRLVPQALESDGPSDPFVECLPLPLPGHGIVAFTSTSNFLCEWHLPSFW